MVSGVTPAGGSWFFLRVDAMMEAAELMAMTGDVELLQCFPSWTRTLPSVAMMMLKCRVCILVDHG